MLKMKKKTMDKLTDYITEIIVPWITEVTLTVACKGSLLFPSKITHGTLLVYILFLSLSILIYLNHCSPCKAFTMYYYSLTKVSKSVHLNKLLFFNLRLHQLFFVFYIYIVIFFLYLALSFKYFPNMYISEFFIHLISFKKLVSWNFKDWNEKKFLFCVSKKLLKKN